VSSLYAGQQVVCIDNGQPKDTTMPSELTVDQIYTIRTVGPYRHYIDGDYIGVRLVGIDRGVCPIWGDNDQPFRASRFRPLVNDRIGMLRALLVPGQPITPTIDEPRRRAPVKEKETTE